MNEYRGLRTENNILVTRNGVTMDPAPSQAIWNHSPDGPNWGYYGSGPAQLALMLALEVLPQVQAVAIYQALKRGLVAQWKSDQWQLTEQELRTYCQFLLAQDKECS